jgi:hypothetical protein
MRLIALVCYLIGMASLIFFVWSALSSLRDDRFGSYSNNQTGYHDPTPTPTPFPVTAKIGETIIIGNIAATLLSVEIIPSRQLDPNDVVLLAHLQLTNLDVDWQFVDALDFVVTTSSGHPWDYHLPLWDAPTWYTGGHYLTIASGRINSGETVLGDLIMTAPLGDYQAKLVWDTDSRKVGDPGWILGL